MTEFTYPVAAYVVGVGLILGYGAVVIFSLVRARRRIAPQG